MKPFVFNTDSFHYRLAHGYGGFYLWSNSSDNPQNICEYAPYVIKGGFVAMLIACVFALVTQVLVIMPLAHALACLTTLTFIALDTSMYDTFVKVGQTVDSALVLIVVGVTCIYNVSMWWTEYKMNKPTAIIEQDVVERQPWFITLAIKSWLGKLCVPIVFVDEDDDDEYE